MPDAKDISPDNDPDAKLMSEPLAEFGARLTFLMLAKGVEVEDAITRTEEIGEAILGLLHETFDLTKEQIEELEELTNTAFNERLHALSQLTKELS